jgi:hypothetical protein
MRFSRLVSRPDPTYDGYEELIVRSLPSAFDRWRDETPTCTSRSLSLRDRVLRAAEAATKGTKS